MLNILQMLIVLITSISLLLGFNQANKENTSSIPVIENSSNTSNEDSQDSSNHNNLPIMNLLLISGHANLEIDPGAVSENRYEYAYNLELVNLLANHIKQNYPYINVILEDAPYKVDKEVNYIMTTKPDYVMNIHFNAGGGTGLEIITPLNNEKLTIATSIVNLMQTNNLPVRPLSIYSRSIVENKIVRSPNQPLTGTDYYGVINIGTQLDILSEIVEIEFIDNKTAIQVYESKINAYVKVLAESIDKYYQTEFI